MRIISPTVLTFVIFGITIYPQYALACIVHQRDAVELKAEAKLVVRAIILSKKTLSRSKTGEIYIYRVQVSNIERGKLSSGSDYLEVTYYNQRAHKRGEILICPLTHGSGIEAELKPKFSYRLFLQTLQDPEILFAEPQ